MCGCYPSPGHVEAPEASAATQRQHTAAARLSPALSPLGEYLYLASDAGNLRQITDAHAHFSTSAVTQARLDQYAVNADGSLSTHAALILPGKEVGVMVAATRRQAVYLAGQVGMNENVAQLRVGPDGRLRPLGSLTVKSEDPIEKMELDRRERCLRVQIDGACGKGRDLHYCPYSLRYRVSPSGKLVSAVLRQRPRTFSPLPPGRLSFSRGSGGASGLVSRALADGALKPLPTQLLTGVSLTAVPVVAAPNGRYLFVAFRDSGADPLTGEVSWPIRVYRVGNDGSLSVVNLQATAPIASPALCTDLLGRFLYAVSTTEGKLYSFRILPDGQLRAITTPFPVGHARSLVVVRVPLG